VKRFAQLCIGALCLTGCAKTTYDTSITEAPAIATTTTFPSGTPAELLSRLVTEAGKLSDKIANNDGKSEQIELIDNVWAAARPQIADHDGVTALNIDGAIVLCDNGAKFNRPADADKCFRNLTALVDNYLSRQS